MKNKKYLYYLIAIFIFGAIASYFTVKAPLLVGNLIDNLFSNNSNTFFYDCFYLFKVYLIIFFGYFLQIEFLIGLSTEISKDYRNNIFSKIHKLNMNTLNSISYGEVLNNFSIDIENISNAIAQALPKIFGGIIVVVFSLYYMFKLNFTITIFLIFVAPIIFCISRFITKRTKNFFEKRATILDELNTFSEETIKNIRTVKNFDYFDSLNEKFDVLTNDLYKASQKAQFFSSLANPSTRLVSNLSYILIGILGIYLVSIGNLTIGHVTSFLLYSTVFIRPFNEFTSVFTELQTAVTSYNRIKKFLNLPNEHLSNVIIPLDPNTKFKGEIEFKNVCFSYIKGQPILENISFHILPGEHFAIVGKTGCGKTTLINLLMRFYEVDSGEILLDGINIKNIDSTLLRKNIGMVLQDNKLFTDTVLANISYGSEKSNELDILRASQLAYADNFIQNLQYKYSTYLSSAEALSSGETQLITIARMFLYHPSILILDEATSNVDLVTEQAIQKSFSNLIKRSTSLTIAHRLSTITNSDKILYMESGKILEIGSHKELIDKHGKYFELYNSQFM